MPAEDIWGIPHPMISRVSNQEVLKTASSSPLADQLVAKQMCLFGRVAMMPDASIARRSVFQPSSTMLARPGGARKRGRPRVSWGQRVRAHALSAAQQDEDRLAATLSNGSGSFQNWKATVRQHCRSLS